MTKLYSKKLTTIIFLLAFIEPVYADLKKDTTVLITGDTSLPVSTKITDSDSSMSDTFSFDKKTVNGTKKTLRCWQEGVLIVAEKGWDIADVSAPLILNNKSQKAYAFNYSETFCLYIGG